MLYLGEFHTNENRSKYITLQLSFQIVGGILQNFIALAILTADFKYKLFGNIYLTPWRVFILANNVIGAVVLFTLMFLPESPKFTLGKRKKALTLKTLHRVYRVNNGPLAAVISCFVYCIFIILSYVFAELSSRRY